MKKNICGIDYVESGDLKSENKIFMVHGYGANMMDLYSLAEEIDPLSHWIFPNGILEVPIGPYMTGRAWFQIDFPQFERSIRSGDFSKSTPTGMTEARKKLEEFILAFETQNFFMGGFSQGAMLTLDLTLSSDLHPKGLLVLSGTLVKRDKWLPIISKKKIPYFQSHGTHDPVLPFSLAEELNNIFVQAQWPGELDVFRGGHEIPYSVIERIKLFINKYKN